MYKERVMNILFLHQSLFPVGGIETLIFRLIKTSCAKDVFIDLLLYQQNKGHFELVEKVSSHVKMLKTYSGMFRSLLLWTPKVDSDDAVIPFHCALLGKVAYVDELFVQYRGHMLLYIKGANRV